MNREFLLNIIFLITVNLLIKPFYLFGIDRTIQNTVETGEYGMYYAFFNFAFLLQIINDFGIQNFNNRNIAQHNHLLDKYFSNILVLKGILGIVYLILTFVIAWALGYLADYAQYAHLIFLLAFNWILISFIFFLRSNISGLAMYRTDSLLSVLDKVLLIVVCSILLWANPFDRPFQISWFVYAQTSTLFITAIIAFLIVYQKLTRLRFRFHKAFLLLILKKSYPYALVVFLMLLYTRMDAVMIERLLADGQIEADYYASAYRLLEASNMIGFLFASLLLPMFARMLKKGEPIQDLVKFSLQMIWAGAIPLTVAIYFFQEDIMVLLYNHGSAYSGQILAYLMFSFVALAGSYIYGTLLTANDSLMKMNVVFVFSVVLNLSLNWYLIPDYKAWGAAVATCVTQFFVFFAQVILAQQELNLKTNISLIIKLISFTLVTVIFAYSVAIFSPWIWQIAFMIALIGGFGLSFVFKLIDLERIMLLVKEKI